MPKLRLRGKQCEIMGSQKKPSSVSLKHCGCVPKEMHKPLEILSSGVVTNLPYQVKIMQEDVLPVVLMRDLISLTSLFSVPHSPTPIL